MTHIQINDLNPSDSELGDELDELTDEELLAINGGDGFISDAIHTTATTISMSAWVVNRYLNHVANDIDRVTDAVANGIKKFF